MVYLGAALAAVEGGEMPSGILHGKQMATMATLAHHAKPEALAPEEQISATLLLPGHFKVSITAKQGLGTGRRGLWTFSDQWNLRQDVG